MMKKLTQTDLAFYRKGADIVSRGSGSATPFCDNIKQNDPLPTLLSLDEVNGYFATVVKFGATGSNSDFGDHCRLALEDLLMKNQLTVDDLAGIVPIEINRSQMDRALHACTVLRKPMIDADYVGWTALPTLPLTRAVHLNAPLNTSYLTLAESAGRLKIKAQAYLQCPPGIRSAAKLENTLRRQSAFGGVAASLFLSSNSDILFPGTVSKSIELGRCIGKINPVADIIKFTRGKLIGSGLLTRIQTHPGKAFSFKTLQINQFTIAVVNEYLQVTCGNKVIVSAPGIIALVDNHGCGIRSSTLGEFKGREVNIIAIPAPFDNTPGMIQEWQRLIKLHRRQQQLDAHVPQGL